MARPDVDRLIAFLREQDGKAKLADVETRFGWDTTKVQSLIDKSGRRIKWANLGRQPGIAQVGVETGGRGAVPLYADVHRVLASTWRRKQGWQAAIALDTSVRGKEATGAWTRPDCVLAYYPARRMDLAQPPTLATYEIEAPGRFDIRSVYEAHAHGYGADFSWAFYVRDGEGPHRDWSRVRLAAKDLGIGLISASNPGNAGTWLVELEARRRKDGDRAEFLERAIPAPMRETARLSLAEMKARQK